jgi:hypothetical protein
MSGLVSLPDIACIPTGLMTYNNKWYNNKRRYNMHIYIRGYRDGRKAGRQQARARSERDLSCNIVTPPTYYPPSIHLPTYRAEHGHGPGVGHALVDDHHRHVELLGHAHQLGQVAAQLLLPLGQLTCNSNSAMYGL